MDVLLTPVVNRFLRRFIKKASGEETSQLRVSLSRGSVALHNLELNLDELSDRLPVSVRRAFARQLTISVPWTSFVSRPLQVLPVVAPASYEQLTVSKELAVASAIHLTGRCSCRTSQEHSLKNSYCLSSELL